MVKKRIDIEFNSKFMNIYEKEIYSYLILTIEHFTFYKKKYLYLI
jgi:hypothetical protein